MIVNCEILDTNFMVEAMVIGQVGKDILGDNSDVKVVRYTWMNTFISYCYLSQLALKERINGLVMFVVSDFSVGLCFQVVDNKLGFHL